MSYRIFDYDPYLVPYKKDIELRMENYRRKKRELLGSWLTVMFFLLKDWEN